MTPRAFAVTVSAASTLLFAACSGGDSATAPPSSGSGGGAVGGGAAGGGDAGPSDGPPSDGDIGLDSGPPQPAGCSADLRQVLDGTGAVLETCPVAEGCSGAKCIPACDAAAASHGSLGCDFLIPTPRTYGPTLQPCFAAFVANAWPKAAHIVVSRGKTSFDATQFGHVPDATKSPKQWPALTAQGLPIDEVAVLYLSSDPASVFVENGAPLVCPSATATGAATEFGSTGTGDAFHVTTDVPVTAYDIFPFGGADSHFPAAELLYPTSAWGKNYVVLATPKGTTATPQTMFGQIVAAEDSTTVTFAPAVDLPGGGGYPAVAKNTSTVFSLNAGQYAQWEVPAGSNDLSGSVLIADKPVSVFAGDRFFRLQTMEQPGGESTHHEILPVSALGSEYVAAPYLTRRMDLQEESIWYRVVGTVDGTTLSYEPPVAGAPTTLGASQVADFEVVGPFRVASQDKDHPFLVAQVMSSANTPSGSRPDCAVIAYPGLPKACGDEEFVPLVSPPQFLSKYVFMTDPTYATTTLEIVRKKTAKGFADVTVDCLGPVTGWQPVGATGSYEYARPDLVRANVAVGSCKNGRHTAASDGPFGLVVFGLDTYSSYGYPAGGNASVLSTTVVQPPK